MGKKQNRSTVVIQCKLIISPGLFPGANSSTKRFESEGQIKFILNNPGSAFLKKKIKIEKKKDCVLCWLLLSQCYWFSDHRCDRQLYWLAVHIVFPSAHMYFILPVISFAFLTSLYIPRDDISPAPFTLMTWGSVTKQSNCLLFPGWSKALKVCDCSKLLLCSAVMVTTCGSRSPGAIDIDKLSPNAFPLGFCSISMVHNIVNLSVCPCACQYIYQFAAFFFFYLPKVLLKKNSRYVYIYILV